MKRWSGRSLIGSLSVLVAMGAVVGCGAKTTSTEVIVSPSQLKIDPKTGYPEYKKKAEITFWSWVPNAQKEVDIFEKYYPNIKVNLVNAGAGSTEYTKFSTVLQAGSGIPDVVMLEYDMMPEYINFGGLADITPFISKYKSDFPAWTLNQVSAQGKIYGVPEDTGPLGLFYQKSVFEKYNLKVPTTWAQFAKEALAFHKQHPNQYFTYFANNDAQWISSLLWQAGISPIKQVGNSWKIDFNTPKAVKVLSMWDKLIKAGAVQSIAAGTPEWEKNLNDGVYATAVGAAWFDSESLVPWDHNLQEHKWNVATIPAWGAGSHVDGDYGGSVDAVTTASKYPEAAAIFATFINTSPAELPHDIAPAKSGGGGLFPADQSAFKLPQFNAANPALDNQKANKDVFSKESSQVYAGFQWSPWSADVFNEMTTELSNAFAGQETVQQALQNVQDHVTNYAKSQGYDIISN